ncbi:LOW QUALITY PROTEIN: 30S ribosomal protein S21, chloroplastic-like [Actinidia eriantha]|uniref:LOW QUALITY PROTEIN: 30S ribosomal protein S21, chloroplastic-like n=1 Tax=Actinidia eriantha TaxID=165200 RepID=UPI0025827368|nr:LOW QUALITY PROTEIN: 30S ribosomal protein S21, chloroplastic-like [Actinidia eriantha]
MASTPISNFLSFSTPTKPPLTQKPTPTPPSLSSRKMHNLVALASSNDGYQIQTPPSDVMAVVCPSLANANTLYFKSAYNVQVIVEDDEPEEKLLGRFRREVMRAGVIQECKRRRFFENKQEEKKRKTREAARRNRGRRFQARGPSQEEEAANRKKEQDDGEDNWDLPEGGIPY